MKHYIKNNLIILIAVLMMGIAAIAVMDVQPTYAEEIIRQGDCDGVPWRQTAEGELIIGKANKTYSFSNDEARDSYPWTSAWDLRITVESVKFEGTVIGNGSFMAMFYNCSHLESFDGAGFDTSNVTDLSSMFSQCYSLVDVDISGFDTKKVTNMGAMFYGCALQELDVTGLDTSSVTEMDNMFGNSSLRELDLRGLDTSSVINMKEMFGGCNDLQKLNISGLDTSNVTDMSGMFSTCNSLQELDISPLDTSNVTDMNSMFSGCSSLQELDVSSFDTDKVMNMNNMYYNCGSLQELDVSFFNTENVINMGGMFNNCSSLKSLNISGVDTKNVKNMGWMFSGCCSLQWLDLSGFDTENVTNMGGMFKNCSSLKSLDLSGFDISNVDYIQEMITGCTSLRMLRIGSWSFDKIEIYRPCFPKRMYDSQTGTVYEENDEIPACTEITTFVSQFKGWDESDIKTLNLNVTEEKLFGEYCRYLSNGVYNEMLSEIQTDVGEIISSKDGLRSYTSALIYGLENVTNAWYDLLSGSLEEDGETDLALELINDLAEDDDVTYEFVKEAKKKLTLSKKGLALPNYIRENGLSNPVIREEAAELMPGFLFNDKEKALEYLTLGEKKWNTSLKVAGTTMTYAEAVMDVWAAMEADAEILNILYANIAPEKSLNIGLQKLVNMREMKSGKALIEPMAENMYKDLLETITGENPVMAFMTLTGKLAYLVEEAADGTHVKSLNKAIFSNTNSYDVLDAVMDLRGEIWKNYSEGHYSDKNLQKEYKVLYSANMQSVLCSADHALKIANSRQKAKLQKKLNKYEHRLTYKKYINSCRQNAMAKLKYVNTDDGVVIVGLEESSEQTSGLRNLFARIIDHVYAANEDEDTLRFLNIPAEIEGERVISIYDDAFADNEELECIYIPGSVENIGEDAFSNCSNLSSVFIDSGTRIIGNNAFYGCGELNEITLPETIEKVGDHAFSGIESIEISATQYSPGAEYAEENDNANLTVLEANVEEYRLEALPSKLTFGMSEQLDTSGIRVIGYLNDGSEKDISDEVFCTFRDKQLGTNQVVVTYNGGSLIYNVEVTADECNYKISYLNEYGEEIADKVTGTEMAGTEISIPMPQIEGYTPVKETQTETIGERNDFVAEYRSIPATDISEASIEPIPDQKYTGKQITPAVSISNAGQKLTENTDYYIDYDENVNAGKGRILVTGIGQYEGGQWVDFNILAGDTAHVHFWQHVVNKAGLLKNGSEYDWCASCKTKKNVRVLNGYATYYVKGLKVTTSKKRFTVKWKKQTKKNLKKFNGYQIRYSTKKSMVKAKTVSVKKTATSKVIKKLKSKTRYYVQVRTYTKKAGKTYYSKWSPKKAVKVK